MKLIRIELENYKKVKKLVFAPGGGNASIMGDNATGKTTVFDAVTWLLYSKDSLNQQHFELKTLDKNGKHLHHLHHSVEAQMLLDNGRNITLKKVYKEKWVRKRGGAVSEFGGHTTDHYINGVKVQAKEYQAKIAGLMEEELFKLLTSPSFFNVHLAWHQRRDVLMAIAGEPTDEEVMQRDYRLIPLRPILRDRTCEDHRKVINMRLREINLQRQDIDVRIDEVQRRLNQTDEYDLLALASELEALEREVASLKERIAALDSGDNTEIRRRIRELEEERENARWEAEKTSRENISRLQQELNTCRNDLLRHQGEQESHRRIVSTTLQQMDSLKRRLSAIKEEYNRMAAQPAAGQKEHCPTCGQALPREQVEAAWDSALKELKITWQQQDTALKELQQVYDDSLHQLKLLEPLMKDHQERMEQAEHRLQQELDRKDAHTGTPEYLAATAEIDALKQDSHRRHQELQAQQIPLRQEMDQCLYQQESNRKKTAETQGRQLDRKRITELEGILDRLAEEEKRLEAERAMVEAFIREKVHALEESINGHFEMARFKLFHEQQNGALVECCETTYNGVPYNSLNNGAKINVGLDIIRTLSRHHGKNAPVFVDNAEAVTRLLEIDSQVIRLVVSDRHPVLTMETSQAMPLHLVGSMAPQEVRLYGG